MLVRLVNTPPRALSVRYLDPPSLRDELFTVDNDLLTHYLPKEDLVVVKRWVGVPLAAIGLASLDLTQLERDWKDRSQLDPALPIRDPKRSNDYGAVSIMPGSGRSDDRKLF